MYLKSIRTLSGQMVCHLMNQQGDCLVCTQVLLERNPLVTGMNEYGSVSTRITMIFQYRLMEDESKLVQSRVMIPGLNACYFTSADVHVRFDED